jgi:hypothetical protein
MKQVAIITLHGMGKTTPDYAEDLRNALLNRVGRAAWEQAVHFGPVFYQDILQHNQAEIWMRMHRFTLAANRLRELMLYGFADAGSLEYSAHRDQREYTAVQQRIHDAHAAAFEAAGRRLIPTVLVAQSLGCHVLSNYIWDSQHNLGLFARTGAGNSKAARFGRLASCRHLVTTGCNIPLFVAGLARIVCFDRPNLQFRWDNYYDANDFLGWPLSPLDPSYPAAGLTDHHIASGNLLLSHTWFSHTQYWTDADVLDPLASSIAGLIDEGTPDAPQTDHRL